MKDFGQLRGFVPNSPVTDVPRGPSEDQQQKVKQELVGKMLSLKVIKVNQQRNRLLLSERTAQQALRMERMSTLKVGEIVKGRVVNLVSFGAFVDLGGVTGSSTSRRWTGSLSSTPPMSCRLATRSRCWSRR